jgi:hypothetical protein
MLITTINAVQNKWVTLNFTRNVQKSVAVIEKVRCDDVPSRLIDFLVDLCLIYERCLN